MGGHSTVPGTDECQASSLVGHPGEAIQSTRDEATGMHSSSPWAVVRPYLARRFG